MLQTRSYEMFRSSGNLIQWRKSLFDTILVYNNKNKLMLRYKFGSVYLFEFIQVNNTHTISHRINMDQKENLCLAKLFFFFFFFIQFYVPFKLFHSYRDESIGRWGENRSTRGKTT